MNIFRSLWHSMLCKRSYHTAAHDQYTDKTPISSHWIREWGKNSRLHLCCWDNLNMLWGNSTLCWHSQGTLQTCLGGETLTLLYYTLFLFLEWSLLNLPFYSSQCKRVLAEQIRFTQRQLMALMANHSAHNSLYSFRSVYAHISALYRLQLS